MRKSFFLKVLAQSLLAGDLVEDSVLTRLTLLFGRRWRWLPGLSHRYVLAFSGGTRPREGDVLSFLRRDDALRKAWEKHSRRISIAHWLTEPQRMQPVRAAEHWGLPPLESVGRLAEWLEIRVSELEWFADRRGLASRQGTSKLRHYNYKILTKQAGSLRLIEAPKMRLKQIQRKILGEILNRIPPHNAVHGFVPTRSIKSFVEPHTGRRVVLRIDLKDFFPSFPVIQDSSGVPDFGLSGFRGRCSCRPLHQRDAEGYMEPGAFGEDPLHLWETRAEARDLYSRRHLPQGAPTSPALANICSYRLDCRLAGLAKKVGAVYTRYADDLAFSGDKEFDRGVERFAAHVAAILHEEGFRVHHRKTRIMRQGVRQHLAGLVANQRLNVRRKDFDGLKAILTSCARFGPETQNRDAHPLFRQHLDGRVGFVEMVNPPKGRRLRSIFDQITWQ